jgi:hypothetical protein
MKREGSAPNLARPTRGERPRTEEFDANDADDDGSVPHPMDTAEINLARDRRVTLMSPIPAAMAETMARDRKVTPPRDPVRPPRDPAAPEPDDGVVEQTRRVGDSDPVSAGEGPTLKSDVGVAPWRKRAAQRIDEARAALDAGDLAAAVTAAEAALRQADEAPAPGIVEVIEPARPLLTRVFTTYVGPSSGLPILAPRAEAIARQQLREREKVLLGRIDGTRTLEELFDGSGLGSLDALRVVARLIRSGAVRIV